jgi:F0F1-type ATP synthase alpha subunit
VLVDASVTASVTADSNDTNSYTVGDMCSISTELATLTPSSIPPGSTVDYLGRHISLLKDGSVSRSLPKAAAETSSLSPPIVGSTSTDGQFLDMWNSKLSTVTPTVSSSSSTTTTIGKKLDEQRPIFVSIPKISDIGLIDSPLVTGITAIDALTPIGLGQNMLVISEEGGRDDGDDVSCGKVNKRGWMMNLLRNVVANHKTKEGNSRMRCYYCLTSGDSNIRSSVWDGIMQAGIQEDIVTLFSNYDSSSSAASSISDKNDASLEAAEAVAVAAAACTLGEHHALTTGGDSLVIIDDINLHKSLWDMTTQELVKVYGVNAVVEADLNGGSSSEMRGFFSGLIQRAARYNVKKGGGSVTLILLSTLPNLDEEAIHDVEDEPTFVASDFDSMSEKIKDRIAMLVKAKVPLTPTNLRKIKLPVPKPSENENAKRLALQHVEDLISMSDGQIWFDAKQGRSPPLDPSRSLTRVGVGADTRNCRADAPALRSVVGSLRFEFQQATDMMSPNSAEGAGKNAKQALRRDAFLLAMHQEPNEGRKLSEECVALLAASRGYLDAVIAGGGMPGTRKGKEALAGMLEYVQNNTGEILHSVDETLDLSFDERNILDEAISEYFS